MKKIVIVPNVSKEGSLSLAKTVAEMLKKNGADIYTDAKLGVGTSDFSIQYNDFPKDADLIIVIGGDGSVIDASALGVNFGVPLLGINLGHLGYLAEVEPHSLSQLTKIFTGEYRIVPKMLLSVKKCCGKRFLTSKRLAVNDVIFSVEGNVGISEFTLSTEQGESVKYRGDGIILATPAGSTAYSLSAGGPVVDHGMNAILATPICPHSFFNRSIIFNENEVLSVKNTGKSILKISVDGRPFESLSFDEECVVFKSRKKLKMLTFSENNTFSTLFGKMKTIENI